MDIKTDLENESNSNSCIEHIIINQELWRYFQEVSLLSFCSHMLNCLAKNRDIGSSLPSPRIVNFSWLR